MLCSKDSKLEEMREVARHTWHSGDAIALQGLVFHAAYEVTVNRPLDEFNFEKFLPYRAQTCAYCKPPRHLHLSKGAVISTPITYHRGQQAQQNLPYIMSSSDLDQLVEMGFDKERAELSLQKGRSCMLDLPARQHLY